LGGKRGGEKSGDRKARGKSRTNGGVKGGQTVVWWVIGSSLSLEKRGGEGELNQRNRRMRGEREKKGLGGDSLKREKVQGREIRSREKGRKGG